MKPVGFIYLTTCLVNGKIYIGQHEISKNKQNNKEYLGSGTLFKRALEKYGKENFKRKILKLCFTEHELTIWEHVYIKKYHSQDKNIGYNIASGNVNTSDYNPTKLPEVRKKISKTKTGQISSFKGKKHSEISRKRLSVSTSKRFEKESEREKLRKSALLQFATKGHPSVGRKMSESSKQKNRMAHLGQVPWNKGKKWSEEVKNKIREAKKNVSEETREKIRKSRIGKKLSEETRKKMSEKRRMRESPSKGKKWSIEQRKKLSVIVSGKNNPMYGKKRITNGVINTVIKSGEPLPDGFWYGFIRH